MSTHQTRLSFRQDPAVFPLSAGRKAFLVYLFPKRNLRFVLYDRSTHANNYIYRLPRCNSYLQNLRHLVSTSWTIVTKQILSVIHHIDNHQGYFSNLIFCSLS